MHYLNGGNYTARPPFCLAAQYNELTGVLLGLINVIPV